MNLARWIVAGLLAVSYLIACGGKLIMPKEKYAAKARGAEDFSSGSVKAIGTLEILAAVDLNPARRAGIAPSGAAGRAGFGDDHGWCGDHPHSASRV
jgi:hypothetical protein